MSLLESRNTQRKVFGLCFVTAVNAGSVICLKNRVRGGSKADSFTSTVNTHETGDVTNCERPVGAVIDHSFEGSVDLASSAAVYH